MWSFFFGVIVVIAVIVAFIIGVAVGAALVKAEDDY